MQDFPNKPLRLLTFAAGGSVDFVARLIAQGISQSLGPVVVENQAELRSIELLTQAPPDGYTLLHFGPQLWTAPLLQKVAYDPVKDVSPVMHTISQPNVLVVHPSVEAISVQELIDLARARPGELKYASGVNGASSQLAGEMFNHMAGVKIAGVPYENTARLGVADLLAGKVDMMIFSAGSAMKHIKAGKLKALGITSLQPSVLFPGWPTVAATVPGYESVHDEAVYAPALTPAPMINRWNQEIRRVLTTPQAREQLANAGMEAVCGSPEGLAAKGKADMAKWQTVIRSADIKANSSIREK